jgi:hypothetical protein
LLATATRKKLLASWLVSVGEMNMMMDLKNLMTRTTVSVGNEDAPIFMDKSQD